MLRNSVTIDNYNTMKNEWIVRYIKDLESKSYTGKVILNFSIGFIPNVKVETIIMRQDFEQFAEEKQLQKLSGI